MIEVISPVNTLPEGYQYENLAKIRPQEKAALMRAAGWNTSSPKLITGDSHYKNKGIAMLDVGVHAEDDQLVGFGRVLYQESSGELCDFVVAPSHQNKGIGKAIIDERLRRAETTGITSLYVPYLTPLNTLRAHYEQRGFHQTLLGELVRGSNPISISQLARGPLKQ